MIYKTLALTAVAFSIQTGYASTPDATDPMEYDAQYYTYLLSFKNQSVVNKIKADVTEPEDESLRKNIYSVKTVYPQKHITVGKIIGSSPGGFYLADKKKWTAHRTIFTAQNMVCSYTYMDLKASGGVIETGYDEDWTVMIGDKKGGSYERGVSGKGFSYSVDWLGKYEVNTLDCATQTHDKTAMKRVIEIAQTIERS